MSPNCFPSTSVGLIIHAPPDSVYVAGSRPPPVTAYTSWSRHGRWVDADMVNATRLESQQLHVCDDNADGDQNDNDSAAEHDADFPGAGHTDNGDGDSNGNGEAGAAGLDG